MGADELQRARELLLGFVVPRAFQVAAELGVADQLADGPRETADLARAVGADPDSLRRLLRLLTAHGVFRWLDDGRIGNSPVSQLLRTDVPGSVRGMVLMYSDPPVWAAWGALLHAVRNGESGFKLAHGVGTFDYLGTHPESGRRFDAAMATSSALTNAAIVNAYDWQRFATVVDVAGGTGGMLAALLAANPAMQGVLFDLPHVVERARPRLAEQGVAARCRVVEGSFFDAVPRGGDVYLLKHIIHDWADDDCLRILRNCRAAMADHATLLICDRLLPADPGPSAVKLMDIVMLVQTEGGRERTEPEFRELLHRADLELLRVVPTAVDSQLLEVGKTPQRPG